MMRTSLVALILALALVLLAGPVSAQTAVPGHQGRDGAVNGHYTTEAGDCHYVVNYRGDFGDDPYLDDGWIFNHISCEDGAVFNYLIVHESDPRYTGDPDNAIWGTWEVKVLTVGGPIDGPHGNLLRPSEAP